MHSALKLPEKVSFNNIYLNFRAKNQHQILEKCDEKNVDLSLKIQMWDICGWFLNTV